MTIKSSEFVRAQSAALRFALLEAGVVTEDDDNLRFSTAVTEILGSDNKPLDLHTAHSLGSLRKIVLDDGTYTMTATWNIAWIRWDLEFQADAERIEHPTGIHAITHWAETSLPPHVQRDYNAIKQEYVRMCPRMAA